MKKNKLQILSVALILAIGFNACSKDDDVVPEPDQEYPARVMIEDGEMVDLEEVASTEMTEGTISRDGNVYALRDFRQNEEVPKLDEDGEPALDDNDEPIMELESKTRFYFDFKENDAADEDNFAVSLGAATNDIDLTVNTEEGYGLAYIDEAFEEVNADDSFTDAEDNKLGLKSPFNPDAEAWANYTGGPNHQVLPVEGRTYVITKEGKPFFKFRINSVYSGEEPEREEAPGNYFFYSIDYQEFE